MRRTRGRLWRARLWWVRRGRARLMRAVDLVGIAAGYTLAGLGVLFIMAALTGALSAVLTAIR